MVIYCENWQKRDNHFRLQRFWGKLNECLCKITHYPNVCVCGYVRAHSYTGADEPLAGSFAEAVSIFSGNEISVQFCNMWLPISVSYFQGTSSVKSACLWRFDLELAWSALSCACGRVFPEFSFEYLFFFCTVSSMQGSSGCYPWSEAEYVYTSLSGTSSRAHFDEVFKHWNRGGESLSYSINMLINELLIFFLQKVNEK